MLVRYLAVFVVALSAAGAAEPPLVVSFTDLVKHPLRYNGRRISTRAYAVTSLYECEEFWGSREAARAGYRSGYRDKAISIGRVAHGYALPRWFAVRLFKVPPHTEGYDGYVQVVGTFQYTDLTPAPTPRPETLAQQPTRPGDEVERVIEYHIRHVRSL